MVNAAPRLHYSFDEYVAFEREAHEKHEYVGGLILATAGGSLEHAGLCSAVISALSRALEGRRCRVFDSNARVRVSSSGNAYYPDASVVCGQLEIDPRDPHFITNPTLLAEVLSPSTADYDRTSKLEDYFRIASLKHVVHVTGGDARIDVWKRVGDGWLCQTFRAGETVTLEGLNCVLDVSAVYRDPLAS